MKFLKPGEDYDFAEFEGKMYNLNFAFDAYTKFLFLLKNQQTRFLAVILMDISIGKIDINAVSIRDSFIGEALIGMKIAIRRNDVVTIPEVFLAIARATWAYFDAYPHLKNNIIRGSDLDIQVTFPFSLYNSKTKVLKKKSLDIPFSTGTFEENLEDSDSSDLNPNFGSVSLARESESLHETLPEGTPETSKPELSESSSNDEMNNPENFGPDVPFCSSKMKDFLSSL